MSKIRISVGLDLGDAESALAVCSMASRQPPSAPARRTIPTVIARRRGSGRRRETLIGVDALTNSEAEHIRVNFKEDPSGESAHWEADAGQDLLAFAEELVRRELGSHSWDRDDTQLVVGCPAAWTPDAAERYAQLFKSSGSLPRDVIVVPESRPALVQFWLTEHGLRDRLLDGSVVVIDIGSSTIDITTISGGESEEDPASQVFGLFDIDDGLLQELLRADGSGLRSKFDEYPSQGELALYLCRLRKEQHYGKTPDPDNLRKLLDRGDWAASCWESLQHIAVPDMLGDATDRGSWLGRFNSLIGDVASRHSPHGPLVIVTGGGAGIPDLVRIVEGHFSGCDVKVAADPELAVAKGLSEYGRLLINGNRFADDVLTLLGTPSYAQLLADLCPRFYQRLAEYYVRHIVDGVWAPMSRLWASGELKLATRGDFRGYALSLFRDWLERDGQQTYGSLMDELNHDVGTIVNDAIEEVRKRLPVDTHPLSLSLHMRLTELFEPSLGGRLINKAHWTWQGVEIRALDRAPARMRQVLSGTFMELALRSEAAITAQLAVIARTAPVLDEDRRRFSAYIMAGVRSALDDTLAEIRLLLLEAHRSS